MDTATEVKNPVIFFDGVCNLCNTSVQFIIKRDKADQFRFASLQSEYAQEVLPNDLTVPEALQSIILRHNGKIMKKSTAALTIAKKLSGGWPLLYAFIIIPKFIRAFIYDLIAKNRYRMFGKKNECMIPTPELKHRFVE